MVEQIIQIEGMTLETAKTGKQYHQFRTSLGKIGVFEQPVVDELSKHIGQNVIVDIAERPGGWKNITKFVGVAQAGAEVAQFPQETEGSRVQAGDVILKNDIVKHEVLNSDWAEVGKAGARTKIYFKTVEELASRYKEVLTALRAVEAEMNNDDN